MAFVINLAFTTALFWYLKNDDDVERVEPDDAWDELSNPS
jgi:hypothetical protein